MALASSTIVDARDFLRFFFSGLGAASGVATPGVVVATVGAGAMGGFEEEATGAAGGGATTLAAAGAAGATTGAGADEEATAGAA